MQGAYLVAGAEDRSLIAALVLSQDGLIFTRRYLRKQEMAIPRESGFFFPAVLKYIPCPSHLRFIGRK